MALSECSFSKLVLRNKWENGNEACKYTIAILCLGRGIYLQVRYCFGWEKLKNDWAKYLTFDSLVGNSDKELSAYYLSILFF